MVGILDKFNFFKKYKVVSSDELTKGQSALDELNRIYSGILPIEWENPTGRKQQNRFTRYGFGDLALLDMYYLYKYSDTLQIIFNTLARETFRNGITLKPKNDISTSTTSLMSTQEERWEKMFLHANQNEQSMIEILKELSKDLDWADDMFLLVDKAYLLNDYGDIVGGEVYGVRRISPLNITIVCDDSGRLGYEGSGIDSKKIYFNVKTRNKEKDERCKDTGLQNLRAHYIVKTPGGDKYYNKDEVLHKSQYNPSKLYGYSPLYSLYQKTLILMNQDDWIKKYYGDSKAPRSILWFNSDNYKGIYSMLDELRARVRQNPHDLHPMIFSTKDGREPMKFIDMNMTLQEMQFTETRNELRNAIGALYGVSPIFQNDSSGGSGLNSDHSMQIVVTNRAVEEKQRIMQEVLDFIAKQMGITAWEIIIEPSEDQDKMRETQLLSAELDNIKKMLDLGLVGEYTEEGKFIFKPGELKPQQQMGFGGMGMEGQEYTEEPSTEEQPQEQASNPEVPNENMSGSSEPINEQAYPSAFQEIGKALPPGAIPLGNKPAPQGAKVIIGSKGGRYMLPEGGHPQAKPQAKPRIGKPESSPQNSVTQKPTEEQHPQQEELTEHQKREAARLADPTRHFVDEDKRYRDEHTGKLSFERFKLEEAKKLDRGGRGSDRATYELPDGKMIKVAVTPRGLVQNSAADDYLLIQSEIIPKVYEQGDDYLVVEKATRDDGRSKKFLQPLQKFSPRDFELKTSELQTVMQQIQEETGFDMDTVMSYNVLWNDFIAPRNWGWIDGKPYHLDEGTFVGDRLLDSKSTEGYIKDDWNKIVSRRKSAASQGKTVIKNIPKQEQKQFRTALEKELEEVIKKLDLKSKPSESELKDLVDKVTKNFDKQLKAKSANRVKTIYSKALEQVAKELKAKEVKVLENDRKRIEMLKRDKPFIEAFSKTADTMNNRLHKVITEAYDKGDISINTLVKRMKYELHKSDSELRNIARTESGKITSSARESMYDRMGKDNFVFSHIGVNDNRTTECCKRIAERTKDGVPWEDYVKIVKEESSKEFPDWSVNPEAVLAHYQCRHNFIGKRKQ